MNFLKEYTSIYFDRDEYGYLLLLFYNNLSKDALFFSGINFYEQKNSVISKSFKGMKYSIDSSIKHFVIDKISQEGDVIFIKLLNGTIFQVSFMYDTDRLDQEVRIFTKEMDRIRTPLDVGLYESVLKSCMEVEDCEVIRDF